MMSYLAELRTWFSDTRRFWFALMGVLVPLACWYFLPYCLEREIRWTGAAFQLAGLLTIGIGLVGRRRLFNARTVWQAMADAASRFPTGRRRIYAVEAVGIVTAGAVASGVALTVNKSAETLEEQVLELTRGLERLSEQVEVNRRSVVSQVDEVSRQIQVEKGDRRQEDDQIRRNLAQAAAGDLVLERIGLVFVALGLVFAGASPEIANWLFGAPLSCPS